MSLIKILEILIILIAIGVILSLLRVFRSLRLEKRLSDFSLVSLKTNDISFFDKANNYLWKLVLKISKILKKSVVLTKYSEKYNKYISYTDKDTKEGINYLSVKFLLATLALLLAILTFTFRKLEFNIMIFLIIFLISFFIPDIYLSIEFNHKRKQIEDDLLKAIIIMNNAFGSGRNIMQAISCVKDELDGPIKDEFQKIYLDITYGLSLDVVFNRFYERVKLEDAKYIMTSLTLLNKTGGDIIKIFSLIEKSIFSRKSLKNELNSLTASSKFVFKMLMFLPFIFIGIIFVLNPSYFKPIFTTSLGLIILVFTILFYILYILIIKRILEVEI
ncbi:MAG: type II secretion system F family protein [Ruminococcus sp.]|nr:type II secretion system F family protein [Ruminococcus sp.]